MLKVYENPEQAYQDLTASLKNGEKYVDDWFDFEEKPCEYLEVLYPGSAPIVTKPETYEVGQGWIGNCGTVANLAGMAEAHNQYTIENIIYPQRRSEKGIYLIRFYRGIHPKWIAIDSRVPTNQAKTVALYAKPARKSTDYGYWGSLLEKAAAQLRGGWYTALTNYDDGSHDDRRIGKWSWMPSKRVWCSNFDQFKTETDNGGYGITVFPHKFANDDPGLVAGHAFAVIDAQRLVDKNGEKHELIRIENPWAEGQDFKGGVYSDDSQFWDENPEFNWAVEITRKHRGSWWMSFDELMTLTNNAKVSTLSPLPHPERPYLYQIEILINDDCAIKKRSPSYQYLKECFVEGLVVSVSEPTDINAILKWSTREKPLRDAPCHSRIIIYNIDDDETFYTSHWGWWGSSLDFTLILPTGTYEIIPYTLDMHIDRGIMQLIIAADVSFDDMEPIPYR